MKKTFLTIKYRQIFYGKNSVTSLMVTFLSRNRVPAVNIMFYFNRVFYRLTFLIDKLFTFNCLPKSKECSKDVQLIFKLLFGRKIVRNYYVKVYVIAILKQSYN